MKRLVLLAVLFIGLICVFQSYYIVTERQLAFVTQFGKIVGEPKSKAGVGWKIPFIQQVNFFDKRILLWDGDPEQIPTKDNKYILVDTTARWRIADPIKFAQTVFNERGARAKLDGILDGVTRDTISSHNLVETVRNSNQIFEDLRIRKERRQKSAEESAKNAEDVDVVNEVVGEVERIQVGREQLTKKIIERARDELKSIGIDLVDVQLRRISYESSVESKVYDRMISEQRRIAEKIRSYGKGEQARITGRLNLTLKTIESEAYRTAQEIRGKAEAEANNIYSAVLSKSPEFYSFRRKLEAYDKVFQNDNNMLLTTDSDFFNLISKRP